MSDVSEAFDSWAVLELMGHRRLGGRVREVTLAGGAFLRIDVPAAGEVPGFTQFYPPGSVYCLTPTTEEIATAIAARARHEPVSRYELPKLPAAAGPIDVHAGPPDRDPYPGEPDFDEDDVG